MQTSGVKNAKVPFLSYAQVTTLAENLLKIKKAFPILPDKKIIEIHNSMLSKPAKGGKKRIQVTTKGPLRKQAIVLMPDKLTENIIRDTSSYVFYINNLLKNIKSATWAEFIHPCTRGISVNTNNVPALSDLTTIEQYLKLIEDVNNDEVLAPYLPQSKSYLKIISIPHIQSNGNKLTSNDIINFMHNADLFESAILAAKPRIIKALSKSNIAIVWFDIWDLQNGSKAKLLINYFFNFGRYITTIRGTNMNLRVSQCHNY